MAKLLVTGGCGFLGSHLVDRLLGEHHRVRVLDDLSAPAILPGRRDSTTRREIVVGDVNDPATVERCMQDMDGCFHLAAVTRTTTTDDDWRRARRTNLGGALEVMTAAARHRVPLVFASSAEVYGATAATPLDERHPTRPITALGVDKAGCELHARCIAPGTLRSAGLRLFEIYGARQSPDSLHGGTVMQMIRTIHHRQRIEVAGHGRHTADYVYVADAVDHLLAALPAAAPDAPVFNVASGQATSDLDVARTLADLVGDAVAIEHRAPVTGRIDGRIGCGRKSRRMLGVRHDHRLAAGLGATLAAETIHDPTRGWSA